jgi:hypothetical protein
MGGDLQKLLEDQVRRAQKQTADEIIDANIKIMAATFDKAVAYSNLLVLAGYASFFGLWQVTRGLVTPKLSALAALLMAISATVFVLFEVAKALFHSIALQQLNRAMTSAPIGNPQALAQAIAQHNKSQERSTVSFMRWWFVAFAITVAAGLGAVGILMSAFIGVLVE